MRTLTPEQNEYARKWLRALLADFKERGKRQQDLAEEIGIDQGRVSALTKAHATDGTSLSVLITAAVMSGRPLEEITAAAGLPLPVAPGKVRGGTPRERARWLAEEAGVSPEAIREVMLSRARADLPVRWWLRQFIDAEERHIAEQESANSDSPPSRGSGRHAIPRPAESTPAFSEKRPSLPPGPAAPPVKKGKKK